jgi:hypothetical protein
VAAEIATEVGAVEEAAAADEAANQVRVPEDLDQTRATELEAISEVEVVVTAETMVVDRRTGGR